MLSQTQLSLKCDEIALRSLLEEAGARFKGRSCTCPFHEDKHPSAGIFQRREDRYWHFKCQGCQIEGDIFDIRARINHTTPAEELKKHSDAPLPTRPAAPQPKIYASLDVLAGSLGFLGDVERVYKYSNPDTSAVEYATIRVIDRNTKKKSFVQCSPTAGGWWMKQPQGLLPIYNRARVRASDVVVVVEGEKCVESLHAIGIVATTSPQGAGKANLADWSMLAGKTVYLWPDNDPINPPDHAKPGIKTGVEHMRDVKRILQSLSPPVQIHWIHQDELDLPDKGDVVDFLVPYDTVEDQKIAIEAVLGDAEAVGFAADYVKELQATIDGKRRTLPFGPWGTLTSASRALMPGTVTCVSGDPGCGKSLAIMEAMVAWEEFGVKACAYELEDDRNYHLRRAHAQAAGLSDLTDNDWVEHNPELTMQAAQQHRKRLEEIGQRIWDAPEEQVTLEMLAVWVEQRAKAGFDIVCIDPITAAATDEKPWIADLKFINRVKTTARRYGCRVILVTHPQKSSGKSTGGIHNLAGGAAYPRFCHTVIWWEKNDEEEEFSVRINKYEVELRRPNRLARITKARNGPGAGKRIAFDFDIKTLRFHEIGIIEKAA